VRVIMMCHCFAITNIISHIYMHHSASYPIPRVIGQQLLP
jgi:hypothetical protein